MIRQLVKLRDGIGRPYATEILNMAISKMEGLSTIDAAPVVHGRWQRIVVDRRHKIEGDECSACGFVYGGLGIVYFRYCPNCRAKMDGGTDT